MSKRFGSILRIGISKTGVTLVQTGGWLRRRSEVLAEAALSAEDFSAPAGLAAKLGGLLAAAHCSRLPVRVVLSDSLVRCWMVSPPPNATRLVDCSAAAAVRFQSLFGEALSGWRMVADWDTRQPFMACAMPQSLLTVLLQVAREHRLVLLEIAPQFVVACNRWRSHLKEDAWFGVMDENVLTVATVNGHGLSAMREVSLPVEAMLDQSRLPQILAGEALRLNVAKPTEIRLCGHVPAHWSMQEVDKLKFTHLDRLKSAQALSLNSGASLALTGMGS